MLCPDATGPDATGTDATGTDASGPDASCTDLSGVEDDENGHDQLEFPVAVLFDCPLPILIYYIQLL